MPCDLLHPTPAVLPAISRKACGQATERARGSAARLVLLPGLFRDREEARSLFSDGRLPRRNPWWLCAGKVQDNDLLQPGPGSVRSICPPFGHGFEFPALFFGAARDNGSAERRCSGDSPRREQQRFVAGGGGSPKRSGVVKRRAFRPAFLKPACFLYARPGESSERNLPWLQLFSFLSIQAKWQRFKPCTDTGKQTMYTPRGF